MIVKRNIHACHRHAGHATEAVGQGGAVHLIPDQLNVERILADEEALEMFFNDGAGGLRNGGRQRAVFFLQFQRQQGI